MIRQRPTSCSGPVSRRAFLKAGVLGLTGLGLGDVMRLRAQSGAASKPPSIILVWLVGGQSHLESYDMKPSAPAEYRGDFRPIHTRVSGMDICEYMPRQAQLADKFSLIRSCWHRFPGHVDGAQMFLTGHEPRGVNPLTVDPDFPDISCVYKALTPSPRNRLPSSIAIRNELYYVGPAYLGRKNAQFVVRNNPHHARVDYQVPNLSIARAEVARFQDRTSLLRSFDQVRRDIDTRGVFDAMDSHNQEAMRLLTSDNAERAFDLNAEPAQVRDRYGRTFFGQGLLMARRLVEAGVGFVSVDGGFFADVHPVLADNWDDHEVNRDIFHAMKHRLPPYDQALCSLIDDLHLRGLERDVLVVVTGEFGRTPKLYYANGTPGRGHYPAAMSILVSGGGMRMGQVIGETDARGEYPKNRVMHSNDFLATMYHYLGIDTRREFTNFQGRPVPIMPHGTPIRELVG